MNRGFRDDVGVEAVAEIDRVDVVTVRNPWSALGSVNRNERIFVKGPVLKCRRCADRLPAAQKKSVLTIPNRCT